MKHRNFIWLLAMLLTAAIALTGCGKDADTGSPASPGGENGTGSAASSQPSSAEPEETTVSLGNVKGCIYTNNYVGYGCQPDESWTFYSAEELQELPGNVQELLADTELGEEMAGMEQITDMMAECPDDLATINVLYQKMDTATRLAYAFMDEDQLLDSMLTEQYDVMVETYTQAGFNVDSIEKVTVSFLGQPRPALKTVGLVQDVDYYILQFFDFDLGRYYVTTTFTSLVEDQTGEIAALFYKLD